MNDALIFEKKYVNAEAKKYNIICKNDDKWSCSFSIDIFCCKNKCIGHVSLRRYPSISPSKAEDKYSWSCMFVIFSTLTCSDVPWLITFSLLKILKLLALLKILKSVFKIFVSVFVFTKTFKIFVRKNLLRKRIFVFVKGTTIRYEDLRKRKRIRFSFSFSYYHKGRPNIHPRNSRMYTLYFLS